MPPKKNIGILIFDDVEELDFVGPLEVFGMAARLGAGCNTFLVATQEGEVRGSYGLRFLPNYTIAACPPLDLLIVPGGFGARTHARQNPAILDFLRNRKGETASVCTGALILAAAGLFQGRAATTHLSAIDLLRAYDGVEVQENVRYVFDGPISSSAGVSAGIDLALALVARMFGQPLAEKVARQLEWDSAGQWRHQRAAS